MKAHEILSDASKWTKGTLARDNKGQVCWIDSEAACQWCLMGAVRVAYPNSIANESALDRIQAKISPPISDWNDDPATTFQDVRNLLLELDV